jgi:NAD-dependent deacetylase
MEAKRNGARMVIVNREPTDQDPFADLVLHTEIGSLMTDTMALLDR